MGGKQPIKSHSWGWDHINMRQGPIIDPGGITDGEAPQTRGLAWSHILHYWPPLIHADLPSDS